VDPIGEDSSSDGVAEPVAERDGLSPSVGLNNSLAVTLARTRICRSRMKAAVASPPEPSNVETPGNDQREPPDPINSPGYRRRRRLVREALQLGESQAITFGDTQEPSLDLGWGTRTTRASSKRLLSSPETNLPPAKRPSTRDATANNTNESGASDDDVEEEGKSPDEDVDSEDEVPPTQTIGGTQATSVAVVVGATDPTAMNSRPIVPNLVGLPSNQPNATPAAVAGAAVGIVTANSPEEQVCWNCGGTPCDWVEYSAEVLAVVEEKFPLSDDGV